MTQVLHQLVNDDPLTDVRGAASYLGLVGVVKHPEQSVRSLARKRRIKSTRIADKIMFRKSWLDKYIEQNTRDSVA